MKAILFSMGCGLYIHLKATDGAPDMPGCRWQNQEQ